MTETRSLAGEDQIGPDGELEATADAVFLDQAVGPLGPTALEQDPKQQSRKPRRCHWTTVAGFTNTIVFKHRGQTQ
jgi:hypothetical protein